ncbi:MAG: hypothetical protein HYT69_02960 [Candidatus Zambryskibacteria bacterium]|nr:hypothetical protein [Candidatus Zambryskibacteria bacterium]
MKVNFYYGLGDKLSDYKALSKWMHIVSIDWNRPERVKSPKCDIAVGFSMGCYLAMDYAERHHVKKLILCSLPPTEKIFKNKADKIIFLMGSKEKYLLKHIRKVSSKKDMYVINGAGHRINANYRKRLLKIIKSD